MFSLPALPFSVQMVYMSYRVRFQKFRAPAIRLNWTIHGLLCPMRNALPGTAGGEAHSDAGDGVRAGRV